jgi:purine-cytosine permease-like protein
MHAAQLGPVGPAERTQPAFDLFLIFAGANIVATTLQAGAALSTEVAPAAAVGLIVAGTLIGSLLVASLSPIGPRLGAPSIVATRAALGLRGAALVAVLLYVTNFAWIAVNNVIAVSVWSQAFPGLAVDKVWMVAAGLLATSVVAGGPRMVGRVDRLVVPTMGLIGIALTVAAIGGTPGETAVRASGNLLRGLDIVIGYQVSWLLMFADYSRYTRSAPRGAVAVFLGLALTSLWLMPLGWWLARVAGSADPGAMVAATGLGRPGAVLLALATLSTNFVNIYLSSLAWKSLRPRTGDQTAVWSIGLVGTALGLLSGAWVTRFAEFMLVLGGVLVPVGGVLLGHYFVRRIPTAVQDLYDERGPLSRHGGIRIAGIAAWAAGSAAYYLAAPIGSTLPSLLVAIGVYTLLADRGPDSA